MKKILLTILSLFLLTGCFSFREKSNSRPAITIDTDYLSGDASYLYYYQSLSSKEKEIYEIKAGNSLKFDGSLNHTYMNKGNEKVAFHNIEIYK